MRLLGAFFMPGDSGDILFCVFLAINTVECVQNPLLGGSGVVISRVISPLIRVISIVILVITLLIATHEPPSSGWKAWESGKNAASHCGWFLYGCYSPEPCLRNVARCRS